MIFTQVFVRLCDFDESIMGMLALTRERSKPVRMPPIDQTTVVSARFWEAGVPIQLKHLIIPLEDVTHLKLQFPIG